MDRREDVIKRTFKISAFLFIAVFILILLLLTEARLKFKTNILTKTEQNMSEPKLIKIKKPREENNHNYGTYIFIYDKKNLNKNPEIFKEGDLKTKIVPKPALCGKFFQYEGFGEFLISYNLIKDKKDDILGIEVFDFNTFKWKQIKTKFDIRKEGEAVPSVFAFKNTSNENSRFPIITIWGGINNKTGKAQNTLEIIDTQNGKLLEKKYFPYSGGKIVSSWKEYHLHGAKLTGKKMVKKYYLIGFLPVRIFPFSCETPIILRHWIAPKDTAGNPYAMLAKVWLILDKERKTANIFAENGNEDNPVENMKEINFGDIKELKEYEPVNANYCSTYPNDYTLLIFKKGNLQKTYILKYIIEKANEYEIKNSLYEVKFNVGDLENAIYGYKDNKNEIFKVKDNEIVKITVEN